MHPCRMFFFFQAEDGIRDYKVTGVQTCALPISHRPRPPRIVAILWGLLGLPALGRCADDGDFARATLRGLQGVYVLIEDLPPESERDGLTMQQLQTDVEEQLRYAGIPVLTKDQAFRLPGAPYLYVYVHLVPHPIGLTAYSILVEVTQRASLDRSEERRVG